MRDIIDITSHQNLLDDKVASNLNEFSDVMDVAAKRPVQPTAKIYSLRESRRDVIKLGFIITCLQKKGTFPLPRGDFEFLQNIFFQPNERKII
jgi:hypothetical protein